MRHLNYVNMKLVNDEWNQVLSCRRTSIGDQRWGDGDHRGRLRRFYNDVQVGTGCHERATQFQCHPSKNGMEIESCPHRIASSFTARSALCWLLKKCLFFLTEIVELCNSWWRRFHEQNVRSPPKAALSKETSKVARKPAAVKIAKRVREKKIAEIPKAPPTQCEFFFNLKLIYSFFFLRRLGWLDWNFQKKTGLGTWISSVCRSSFTRFRFSSQSWKRPSRRRRGGSGNGRRSPRRKGLPSRTNDPPDRCESVDQSR